MNEIREILENMLRHLTDEFELEETKAAGTTVLMIKTPDSKLLIGARGRTLKSLDYLINKIAKEKSLDKVMVDVNEYKLKEIKEVEEKAQLLANRAKSLKYDVEMPPMSAYERLIVHAYLSEDPELETESHGEGENRRLVIKYIGGGV